MNLRSNVSRSLATCATIFGSSTAALAGNVLVVAAVGPADFNAIQPAVNAALDGDTILVKSGSYASFTIDGKGVHVVEDAGADVVITSTVTVQNVPAASRVILSGLRIAPIGGRGLVTQNNSGALRFFHCEISGSSGLSRTDCDAIAAGSGQLGARIASSSNVAFSRSSIEGGSGGNHACAFFNSPGRGDDGLLLTNGSTVAAHATTIRGGDAGDGGDRPIDGAWGAWLSTGPNALFASDCVVEGGDGSNIVGFECFIQPGDGGGGLAIDNTSTAQLLGPTLLGGNGGVLLNPFCNESGADGVPSSGTWFPFAVSPIGLDAAGVVREGQSIAITVSGDPGDTVHLLEGSDTAFQNIPSWRGFLLVERETPSRVRKLGVIPGSGTLTRMYHADNLPSGVESAPRYLQAYRTNAVGVTLGGFVPLVVVDSAF